MSRLSNLFGQQGGFNTLGDGGIFSRRVGGSKYNIRRQQAALGDKLGAEAASIQSGTQLRQQLFNALLGGEGGGLFGGLFGGEGGGGDFGDFGEGFKQDVAAGFDEAGQSALANLSKRGLGSSNLVATTQLGTEREKQRALGRVEDQITSQKMNFLQGQQRSGLGLISALLGGLG